MRIGLVQETKPAERRVGLTESGVATLIGDGNEVLSRPALAPAPASTTPPTSAPEPSWWTARTPVGPTWSSRSRSPSPPSTATCVRPPRCLPTGTWPPTGRSPTPSSTPRSRRSRTRPSRTRAAYSRCLTPMSEIAGRLAAHAAGQYLMHPHGGPGLLLGGSLGVAPAKVVILGGGVVGTQAASLAVGMCADVTILDVSPRRVRELEDLFGNTARVLQSDPATMLAHIAMADVVIGAVLVPGAAAPKLVSREDLARLKPDALLIYVAIRVDGIVHYCVANMPGAVPHTSTRALTNATLPYVRRLANLGVGAALAADPRLARGLNTWPER